MLTSNQTEKTKSTAEALAEAQARQAEIVKPDNSPLSPSDLLRLETMPKDELRTFIQTICNARWGEVALMTKQQRAEAGRLKLWHAGLTEKEVYKALPMLKEAFDRDEGKSPQSMSLNVKDDRLDKMPIDQLLRLASMLDEPIVIPPLPSKE